MNRPMILPRALIGRVHAEQTPQQMFGELSTTVQDFIRHHNERLDNVTAAVNAMGGASGISPVEGAISGFDTEYSRIFASYFRRGDGDEFLRSANGTGERATIQAAMSVGDNSTGGYLAPVEWDRKIAEAQRAASPLRRLATVLPTSVGAYTTLWNTDQWGSGWVGETAGRPQTSTASLSPITFAAGEIYAMPAATQRLLDDAAINVDQWLVQSVQKEFNRQEGIAFLAGDGVNKPAGLLTFAEGGSNAATHPGGAIHVTTAAISVDGLIDFMYGLAAPYRQNATWLMSSLTAAHLSKMKDADGNLIWRESLISGQPSTLLGHPVEIDEGMAGPDAGAIPIAFGDFKAGYLINDRIGTRVLRDPFTNKPYVMFYVTKRVGGGVLDPNAIRLLKLPA
jgi:HK97 family phage major capsid protein